MYDIIWMSPILPNIVVTDDCVKPYSDSFLSDLKLYAVVRGLGIALLVGDILVYRGTIAFMKVRSTYYAK